MRYQIIELLSDAAARGASDVHLSVGLPPMFRLDGSLIKRGEEPLTPEDTRAMAWELMDEARREAFLQNGEVDFSFSLPGKSRFRVSVYSQRKSVSAAIRVINHEVPTLEGLGLPEALKQICTRTSGMFLVTGPTGSGKSTTLAAMVDYINATRGCHIITIEDPIEYLHQHKKAMVNQREIGDDTKSFQNALRAALREDPDVILVGEMRDLETIQTAVTAAETGHLVFATLHTIGAAATVDRIIDVFPSTQQKQIRTQLASSLIGVLTQRLLPLESGLGRVAAVELMLANDAVKNLIREAKAHQINTVIQTSMRQGMQLLDYSIAELLKARRISRDTAFYNCLDEQVLLRYIDAARYSAAATDLR